ncbi:hypothetical protein J2046_004171, partial [Rhizobium petrolearium]|nr:hypothetical protein [Neorhizobium petrolearium]
VAFHGINTSRQKAKSVTHVSGTKRHLSLGLGTSKMLNLLKVRPVGDIGATYILFDRRSEAPLASFFLSASFV